MPKLRELISKLEQLEQQYGGDIEVVCYGNNFEVQPYNMDYIKIANKVIIVRKNKSKGIALSEPWDFVEKWKKENLKSGRVLTNKKVLKL